MKNIRSRLIQIFIIEIIALGAAATVSLFLYVNALDKYKAISDNMVSEYHLTVSAAGLISEFNQLAVSSTTSGQAVQRAKIDSIKSQINQTYATLDRSITDSDTKDSYIGLRNAIDALTVEIDAGLVSIQDGGGQNATLHYNNANKLYSFVKDDGNTFLTDELKHVAVTQKEVKSSAVRNFEIGAAAYVAVSIGSIFYAVKISKRVVRPIHKLTSFAEQITRGNMEAQISPELLTRQDETGRLSNSFNMMLLNLKDKIHELNVEKASVEQKVIDRTQELNDEKARLEASINSIDVGFIMTGANDDIIMLNQVATHLLAYTISAEGVSKADISAHQWTTKLVNQKMGSDFPFAESIAKAKSSGLPIEKKELPYGGRVFRIFVAPIISRAGQAAETLGTVTLIEDITERKVQERSKDEFFSIASHELRTPLTAIRGNTAMIQSYYKDQLIKDENMKGMVDDIHESSVRLLEIVSDFLDVSRLEQGKLKFEPENFELDTVIESVAYELGANAQAKGVELIYKQTPEHSKASVCADKNRTKQVIYNLVGNALKFTDKGSITLEIEQEGSQVKVLVSDTGPGISAGAQQLLFHKFQQAGDSLITRDTAHGTGLGLYISKLIVEGMGGSIQLESSVPGTGSVFSFSLPYAKHHTRP
jgi:two-component system phosphate regulon sensor histidine kinase PhoR